jgi:hypothetical protein
MNSASIKSGDIVTVRAPWGGGFCRLRVTGPAYTPSSGASAGELVVDVAVVRHGDGYPQGGRASGVPVLKLELRHDVKPLPARKPFKPRVSHPEACGCDACFDAAHARYLKEMSRA